TSAATSRFRGTQGRVRCPSPRRSVTSPFWGLSMRFHLHRLLGAVAVLVLTNAAWAQDLRLVDWTPTPGAVQARDAPGRQDGDRPNPPRSPGGTAQSAAFRTPEWQPQLTPVGDSRLEGGNKEPFSTSGTTVAVMEKDLKSLQAQLAAAQAGAAQ